MHEDEFSKRLSSLRQEKGASARDMSLSLGQNAGYINNIENGHNLPSMTVFFYICEYLGITPKEFFDYDNELPDTTRMLLESIQKLDRDTLVHLTAIVVALTQKKWILLIWGCFDSLFFIPVWIYFYVESEIKPESSSVLLALLFLLCIHLRLSFIL